MTKHIIFAVFLLGFALFSCEQPNSPTPQRSIMDPLDASMEELIDIPADRITVSLSEQARARGAGIEWVNQRLQASEGQINIHHEGESEAPGMEAIGEALQDFKGTEHLEKFLLKNYGSSQHTLTQIELELHPAYRTVLFEFTTAGGVNETVLYGIGGGAGGVDPVATEVTCTGECGCRERYVFANPPYTECTCEDCVMIINQTN